MPTSGEPPHIELPVDWSPETRRAYVQAMRDEGLMIEERDDSIVMRRPTPEQDARVEQRMRELSGEN